MRHVDHAHISLIGSIFCCRACFPEVPFPSPSHKYIHYDLYSTNFQVLAYSFDFVDTQKATGQSLPARSVAGPVVNRGARRCAIIRFENAALGFWLYLLSMFSVLCAIKLQYH